MSKKTNYDPLDSFGRHAVRPDISQALYTYGVTIKEVAEYMHISRSTFYRWCNDEQWQDTMKPLEILDAIKTVSSLKYD